MILRTFLITWLFLIITLPSEAVPVTSPFGPRDSPASGASSNHKGIDLGFNHGDPIPATDKGIVNFAGISGTMTSGYGKLVCITHPDGSETYYAHLDQILVSPGQNVKKGEFIGLCGQTGVGTGPHLHFEYRPYGVPVDPSEYLVMFAGWNLESSGFDYGDNPYISAPEAQWNFDGFYQIGVNIVEIMNLFVEKIINALDLIKKNLFPLAATLGILDFIFFLFLRGFSPQLEDVFARFMKYAVTFWIIANWGLLINETILGTVVKVATSLVDVSEENVMNNITNPSLVVQKGIQLTTPVFSFIQPYTGVKLIANTATVLMALIIALTIIFSFAAIGITLALFYVEFYCISLFSVVMIPFNSWEKSAYLAKLGINAVINSGIKLLITVVSLTIMVTMLETMQPITYSPTEYLGVAIFSLALVGMAFILPMRITALFR